MFYWIDESINESDEVWRLVHQNYVMSQIKQKLHSIKKTDLTLLFPIMYDWIDKRINGSDGFQCNQQKYEWDWFSMKVSASKLCDDSNHTKHLSN